MTSVDTTVQSTNFPTQRWAAELTADANEVISGVGAWALLITLLAASSGEAQPEIERAWSMERSSAGSSWWTLGLSPRAGTVMGDARSRRPLCPAASRQAQLRRPVAGAYATRHP